MAKLDTQTKIQYKRYSSNANPTDCQHWQVTPGSKASKAAPNHQPSKEQTTKPNHPSPSPVNEQTTSHTPNRTTQNTFNLTSQHAQQTPTTPTTKATSSPAFSQKHAKSKQNPKQAHISKKPKQPLCNPASTTNTNNCHNTGSANARKVTLALTFPNHVRKQQLRTISP